MSELNKAVADLVIKATQAAEAAGKFAVEQLPDVAHQYVLITGVWACVSAAFWLAIATGFAWATYFCFKKLRGEDKVIGILPFGCAFGTLIFAMSDIKVALTAFLAPKILLIQWAAELVK